MMVQKMKYIHRNSEWIQKERNAEIYALDLSAMFQHF